MASQGAPLKPSDRKTTTSRRSNQAATAERTAAKSPRKQSPVGPQRQFRHILRGAALEYRIQIERQGVPSAVVLDLIGKLGVSALQFQRALRIPKATFAKKVSKRELFAGTSGQSVLGLLELINKVEDMLDPEDNPSAKNFDVEKWVGEWLVRPQPTLGGKCPVDLMDTQSGREKVKQVLGALQSGVYL